MAMTTAAAIVRRTALAQWIARVYVTPLGMVINAMVPTAVKDSVGATPPGPLR